MEPNETFKNAAVYNGHTAYSSDIITGVHNNQEQIWLEKLE